MSRRRAHDNSASGILSLIEHSGTHLIKGVGTAQAQMTPTSAAPRAIIVDALRISSELNARLYEYVAEAYGNKTE